ncbi:Tc5 transposase DNA-binding domain-containing protein [Hirsutella rhossiliensis]
MTELTFYEVIWSPQVSCARLLRNGDTPEYYFQQNARDQEANLVAWTLRQESLGYGPSQSQIRACVVAVLKQQGCDSRLGRLWVEKFIQRHPELRGKVAVHWYFDIREKEYGWIKPENTVNVDEGGIMSGFGLDSLVVGSSDPKRKTLLKGPQSRSWTTFIEAITADGRALTPDIIFKALSFWMDMGVMQRH